MKTREFWITRHARTLGLASMATLVALATTSCMHLEAERYSWTTPDTNSTTEGKWNKVGDGFAFYEAEPYIAVTYTVSEKVDGNSTTTTQTPKAEIVYLPNYAKVTTVEIGGWFGSAELSFELDGPMMANLNSKVDSKTPETIKAVSALLPALTSALAEFQPADPTVVGAQPKVELYRMDFEDDSVTFRQVTLETN